MAEFNYTEYLKNNPLLQEEIKGKLLTESQEVSEEAPSSKTTVSALKAEIKEMILASILSEEEEDDIELAADTGEEDTVEPEMDMDEPTAEPSRAVGLTPEEQSIQSSLKDAYDNATAMGDEKLAAQIGNSITFFTRTHVVER